MPVGVPHHRPGAASIGDRSPARFLCPVCARHLLTESGDFLPPCDHVVLVHDGSSLAYWRDDGARELFVESARHAGGEGANTVEHLRARLGPEAVFFHLHEQRPESAEVDTLTFVVDLAAPGRAAALAAPPRALRALTRG